MSTQGKIYLTAAILFALVAGVITLTFFTQGTEADQAREMPDLSEYNTYLYEEPRGIREFELLDHQGQPVDNEMLLGQWTIAFIGFTYCPDICPATMATLSRAAKQISPDVPDPQFLMISADPERDTPEQLSSYVTFFGDDFQGVTGDKETLRKLARDLNAVFTHREDDEGEVVVDHSAHLALISPHGNLVGMVQPPIEADKVTTIYHAIAHWIPPQG